MLKLKECRKAVGAAAVAAMMGAFSITAAFAGAGDAAAQADGSTVAGIAAAISEYSSTEAEGNGVAGIAAALNSYEAEAAGIFDTASVEKEESVIVTASAEAEDIADEAAEDEDAADETVSLEDDWADKLMADVDDFLYVRAEADADSEAVGKLYKGDRALVKEQGDEWTKIVSGSVEGYVKNEYCLFGQEALEYAKGICDTIATATTDCLRVRNAASADAGVVTLIGTGEKLTVDTDAEAQDGWVAVLVGTTTCYVSEDYVNISIDTGKGVTIAEEKAAEAAAAAAKAAASSSSSSKATTHAAVAASTDDETLLAALIQCEAGGESLECMEAVGAVVLNRVRSGSYPNTISGVIYQSGQFGPASSGRLASRIASGVSSSARKAAQAALAGTDPTGGAKYFHSKSSGHSGTVIGGLVFY
ncbi:MAG: cell wall hydrolase [Clostridiales bacterium]|nr:cell wall hydrolase [Clostridiales bacterium]